MLTMLLRRLYGTGLTIGVCCLAVPALAGPAEDYASARRAYAAGDVVNAMPILRKAADAGYAPAQVLLGEILDLSEYDEEAAAMYRKAARQGDAEGQFRLGSLYSQGEGVKKDVDEARRLIRASAEQGHVQATNVMAESYLNALLGIPESDRHSADSLRWVTAAAEGDYLPAIDALALAYRNGGFGLTPDAKEAERLTAKANALRNIQQSSGKGKGRRR
jgi:uncharacterized protein